MNSDRQKILTDYIEEGQEVGLTFYPEDIHVMEKMVF